MIANAGLFGARRRQSEATFRPQLTSLIDVMTILLVFLIKSFSVEGNLITPSSELALPLSTSDNRPEPTPTVAVTRTAALWEGKQAALLSERDAEDSLLIGGLYEALARYRQQAAAESPRLLIQADRDLPFDAVKRVMYSCGKAGYTEFEILVMREG
jgi:biopolymer transport protein ExbD